MFVTFWNQITFVLKNISLVFGWRDALDIALIAVFLYFAYLLFRRTNSFFIIDGVVLLFVAFLGAKFLEFNLTALLLQYFFGFFIVIMAIIFREELRSFFESISIWGKIRRTRSGLPAQAGEKRGEDAVIDIIRKTLDYLANKKIGALLVFPGGQPLDRLLQGGVPLHGDLSVPLLLSIFDPTSPGHDGAALIDDGMLVRFSAHLPLAERYQKLRDVGTRHRAAVGLSEKSDAFVLAVSEERGTISLARFGKLIVLQDAEDAATRLSDFFDEQSPLKSKTFWKEFFFSNFLTKIFAIIAAFFLWFLFVFQPGHVTRVLTAPVEYRFLSNDVEVTRLLPTEVSVTASGKANDFELLDERTVRIIVDGSSFKEGRNTVSLEKEMVQLPRSFSIIEIDPTSVRFEVEKKEILSEEPKTK